MSCLEKLGICMGVPDLMMDENILKSLAFFGQYGKIQNIVL